MLLHLPTHDNLRAGTAFIVPIWQVEKLSCVKVPVLGHVCARAGLALARTAGV